MTSPLPHLTFTLMRVDAIRVSDMVDLAGDPYADPDPSDLGSPWPFEYGAVSDVERETEDCVRLDFTNSESVGFPPWSHGQGPPIDGG